MKSEGMLAVKIIKIDRQHSLLCIHMRIHCVENLLITTVIVVTVVSRVVLQ